jgi:pyruvyltransferase
LKSSANISLFYWSEIKFLNRNKENYGDLLSKYLVENISGKKVKWVHPKKQPWFKIHKKHYLTVGSIIHHATKDSVVWGSGIIDKKQSITKGDFRAVRGPKTREYLIQLGYYCPEIYGDPALLLPKFYNPLIEKKYKLGIIPHYNDYSLVLKTYLNVPDVIVIDLMTIDVEEVTRKIMSCEKTISSSLHGIIVSHAYGIPSVWVEFSKNIFGDGVKYVDYLTSVGLTIYQPEMLVYKKNLNELLSLLQIFPNLPKEEKISELQKGLIKGCPFN